MQIHSANATIKNLKTDSLIVGIFESEKKIDPTSKKISKELEGVVEKIIASKEFSGKANEFFPIYINKKNGVKWMVLLGLGKKTGFNPNTARSIFSSLEPFLERHKLSELAILVNILTEKKSELGKYVQALIESLTLSSYKFLEYKTPLKSEKPFAINKVVFLLNTRQERRIAEKAAQKALILSRAVIYSRDLANHPGNQMTPQHLAEQAIKLAKSLKLKCKILNHKNISELGMGAFLSVNQGSALPPKFIILEYNEKKKGQPVVLVGKGITFDSGGISLKPSKNMEEMKFDMCGAATVLGVIKAAAEIKSPLKLVGLIPATENLPSGTAVKPGDVVKSMSGKTIEIINTDAEGRMILSDALAYAARYKPKLVIDFATLTGACVVALGTDYSGAFATNSKFLKKLAESGEKTGEKIWPLPLAEEYKEQIKSSVADIKNVGNDGQGAGTITAALFLQEFISYPWIHLDIAGTAWTTYDKPYKPKGATGTGVRLIYDFLTSK